MKKLIPFFLLFIKSYLSLGQIGIGTTTPHPSSILEISSSTKGFLLPRLTNYQIKSINNPAEGLMVYSLDLSCLVFNIGSYTTPNWHFIGGPSIFSNDCDINGFEGDYVNGVPLVSSNKFSVTIYNNTNSFITDTTVNLSVDDLKLSGLSGYSVTSVSPTTTTISYGSSQLVEYNLAGSPSNVGELTGVWQKFGLNCTKTINIANGDATFNLPKTAIVVSVYDGLPLADLPGVVDNGSNQIIIDIPYTDGKGAYEAFSGTYSFNNTGTSEAGDANSFRLTYPSGVFNTTGKITATIEVDGDGSFLAKKLLFHNQLTIASLNFEVNGTHKGNVNLDASGGIPDREFNNLDGLHRFIYLPTIAKDGRTWLNNNLGANYSNVNKISVFDPTQQAQSKNGNQSHQDFDAYGSLYQWGRYSDGHELMNWNTATSGTPNTSATSTAYTSTITPQNSLFYKGSNASTRNYNWLDLGASPNPVEDGLWQGQSGPNNPCPQDYRLPTRSEFSILFSYGAESIVNLTQAVNSSLALPASGDRLYSSGNIDHTGTQGYYWSSTIFSSLSSLSYLSNGAAIPANYNRSHGCNVRCIKD